MERKDEVSVSVQGRREIEFLRREKNLDTFQKLLCSILSPNGIACLWPPQPHLHFSWLWRKMSSSGAWMVDSTQWKWVDLFTLLACHLDLIYKWLTSPCGKSLHHPDSLWLGSWERGREHLISESISQLSLGGGGWGGEEGECSQKVKDNCKY